MTAPPLTRAQRASDTITAFCGSWGFVLSFSGITVVWMSLNIGTVTPKIWDPYPFILLNLFLTVISTFQSPLIMMSQNRQVERDREMLHDLHTKFDELREAIERIEGRL